MALVRPITDDPDMRDALDAAVATFFDPDAPTTASLPGVNAGGPAGRFCGVPGLRPARGDCDHFRMSDMSVHLHDHAEWIDELEPASRELLEHTWSDATKVFSARGLDNYVKGASALRGLGRGAGPVDAWIDSAPQVAKEVGEDVVGELATTALMLASQAPRAP